MKFLCRCSAGPVNGSALILKDDTGDLVDRASQAERKNVRNNKKIIPKSEEKLFDAYVMA